MSNNVVRCSRCQTPLIAEEVKGHDCSMLTITNWGPIIEAVYAFFDETEKGMMFTAVDRGGRVYRFKLTPEMASAMHQRWRV